MFDSYFRVRCEAAEKVAFEAVAREEGLSLSEWIRQLGRERVEARYGLLIGVGVSTENGHGNGNGNFSWE